MSATWSVEQRRCLAALGYTLVRSASADAHGQGEAAAAAIDGAAVVAPRSAAQASVIAGAIAPLLHALIRAAGQDPARIDVEEWTRAQRIPSLAQLRSNPAAKRALWPQLRGLRRERAAS